MAIAQEAEIKVYDKHYINGEWVSPAGSETIDVINAATEEVMGRIPAGTAEDLNRAVGAAKAAFETWGQSTKEERLGYLQKILGGLAARQEEIAQTIAGEVGMPISMSKAVQAALPMAVTNSMIGVLQGYDFEKTVGNSVIVREPVGVVGCITPWNFPLHQITNKVIPAIAAGCTVVLKPTEIAPLAAMVFCNIVHESGLPAGVFNLVNGTGPVIGEAMSSHPDIDMMSFTGSTRAGKRVFANSAETIKRVALELGGKSANIILDDADLSKAVPGGVSAAYLNSGQTCSAHTRMLVPKDKMDEAAKIAGETAAGFTLGDPTDPTAKLGPLISDVQRDRVRTLINKGVEEGAELVCGGAEAPEEFPKGYYVKPTVFKNVTNDMTIAQQEIFGPVLSIIGYEDEEDAIRIANDTVYGLSGGVWSGDEERAKRVARRIRTGQVDINGGGFNPMAPFGGYKQSGCGREMGGEIGFEEFLEIKSMQT